ncbi:threonine-rich protein-like isoform X4 [Montipora capricornis]|uniref:threonine-rich protein-like isoform X4 n=1 Tax=Montipora capricornis TaxID=246305 RepID=UPI0035F1D3C6
MSDTCVEMYHCGAVYPGWLSGGHPSVKDGAVVRRVCFNGYYGCCHLFTYISVRNCGGFYVYKLTPLHTSSNCYCRYCASNGTALVLPKTLTTEISRSSTAQATTKSPTIFVTEFSASSTSVTTTEPLTKLSLSSTVQTATEPLTNFVSELLTSSAAQTTGTPTTFLAEITSTTAQTTTRTPPRLSTSSTAQTTTEPPTSNCT